LAVETIILTPDIPRLAKARCLSTLFISSFLAYFDAQSDQNDRRLLRKHLKKIHGPISSPKVVKSCFLICNSLAKYWTRPPSWMKRVACDHRYVVVQPIHEFRRTCCWRKSLISFQLGDKRQATKSIFWNIFGCYCFSICLEAIKRLCAWVFSRFPRNHLIIIPLDISVFLFHYVFFMKHINGLSGPIPRNAKKFTIVVVTPTLWEVNQSRHRGSKPCCWSKIWVWPSTWYYLD
jgi:hypothetical protein